MAVHDSVDPLKEHKAILALIHKFLSGISSRDPALMHSCILPTGTALLIRPATITKSAEIALQAPTPEPQTPPPPTRQHLHLTLPQVIDRIPFQLLVSIEENIALAEWEDGDDGDRYGGRKTEIRVYEDVAFAWTPFETKFDGVVQTVGMNMMTFVRRLEGVEGEWVISYVGDTCRKV
ncbi:hypothetical protein VTL71DRAFT_16153 [Oculimacula yallundae]|uniref:Uncharacterized protein n=1 Tax=Oculimacula yallundae TaxID=86028 RepID=A0ABR4CDP1_9HELO